MNLKEAFRYQTYLDTLMNGCQLYITTPDHCLKTTEFHHKSVRNPDAADEEKVVEKENPYHISDVIAFAQWLIEQKITLTEAISIAKSYLPHNVDALVESNKFRQRIAGSMNAMLGQLKARKVTTHRQDYKFNAEGNQMAYNYDVDIVNEELFDRSVVKRMVIQMMAAADETSAEIDSIMVNTDVLYAPRLSVNGTFEDAMDAYLTFSKDET